MPRNSGSCLPHPLPSRFLERFLLPATLDNMPGRANTGRGRTAMFQIARSTPPTMEKPPGYSHVVVIEGGARIVFFAGQLGVDTAGAFAGGRGDFKAQALQAFEN